MKRLFLFLLFIGAFFCFNNVQASIFVPYDVWPYDENTSYYTSRFSNTDLTPKETGLLNSITLKTRVYGSASDIYWQFSSGACSGSALTTGGTLLSGYDPSDIVFPVNTMVVKNDPWCLRFRIGTLSTFGTNIYYATTTDPNMRIWQTGSLTQQTINAWVELDTTPSNELFYFGYPNGNSILEYEETQNFNVKCYNSSSYVAKYYDNDYLNATTTDFVKCNEYGWYDGTFAVLDGARKIVVLDQNYLTTPTDGYIRELNYNGVIAGLYDLLAYVKYPEADSQSGYYTVPTADESFNAKLAIFSKNGIIQPNVFENVFGIYYLDATSSVVEVPFDEGDDWSAWTEYATFNGDELLYSFESKTYDVLYQASSTASQFRHYIFTYYNQDEVSSTEKVTIGYNIFRVWDENYDNPAQFNFNKYADVETATNECEYNVKCVATRQIYGDTYCFDTCGGRLLTEDSSFWQSGTTGFCRTMCSLIYPKNYINGKITSIDEFLNALQTRPPFGYFYVYKNALTNIASSTTSTLSGWEALGNWTFFAWIRTLMGYLVYLLFGFVIYKMFTKFL